MISTCSLGRLAVFSLFGLSLGLVAGCENPAPPPTNAAPTSAEAPAAPGATAPAPAGGEIKSMPVEKKEGAANDVKLTDDELAELKKLPADDQKIAMDQKVCPVSDSHLGSMDAPIKQVVNGKTFFLCCAGCEDKVKSDPAAVLAKLPK